MVLCISDRVAEDPAWTLVETFGVPRKETLKPVCAYTGIKLATEGAMARSAPSGIATPIVHDEKRVIKLNYLAFALLFGASGASSPPERHASVAVTPARREATRALTVGKRRDEDAGAPPEMAIAEGEAIKCIYSEVTESTVSSLAEIKLLLRDIQGRLVAATEQLNMNNGRLNSITDMIATSVKTAPGKKEDPKRRIITGVDSAATCSSTVRRRTNWSSTASRN